jgi:outer membrane protein assembly factor BamB
MQVRCERHFSLKLNHPPTTPTESRISAMPKPWIVLLAASLLASSGCTSAAKDEVSQATTDEASERTVNAQAEVPEVQQESEEALGIPNWRQALCSSTDGMIEDGGTLYFGCFVSEEKRRKVKAADAFFGATAWERAVSCDVVLPAGVVLGSLIVRCGKENLGTDIFQFSSLIAFNAATGDSLWATTLPEWPVEVHVGSTIFALGKKKRDNPARHLYLTDLEQGASGYSSDRVIKAFASREDGSMCVITVDGFLECLENRSATQWRADYNNNIGALFLDDSSTYSLGNDGQIRAFTRGAGTLAWRSNLPQGGRVSFVLDNKDVLAVVKGKGVYSLDRETGTTRWQYQDPEAERIVGSGPKNVYAMAGIYVTAVERLSGKFRWKHRFEDDLIMYLLYRSDRLPRSQELESTAIITYPTEVGDHVWALDVLSGQVKYTFGNIKELLIQAGWIFFTKLGMLGSDTTSGMTERSLDAMYAAAYRASAQADAAERARCQPVLAEISSRRMSNEQALAYAMRFNCEYLLIR